jgi:hypothetical protein
VRLEIRKKKKILSLLLCFGAADFVVETKGCLLDFFFSLDPVMCLVAQLSASNTATKASEKSLNIHLTHTRCEHKQLSPREASWQKPKKSFSVVRVASGI